MSRPEPVKVPLEEIRRTLEDLDRQRARDRAQRSFEATQPRNRPGGAFVDETAIQVPLDEIRRALSDLDRQHVEERGGGKAMLPPEEIARTINDLGRQHAEETTRRRRIARSREVIESDLRNGKLRVPLEEDNRTVDSLDHRHTERTAHQREPGRQQEASKAQTQGETVMVPLEEITRTLADLDQQHTEETTRRRPGERPQEAVESLRGGRLELPAEEITRTLKNLDRERAEETLHRRQGTVRQGKILLPPEEIARYTLDELNRRHSGGTARPRQRALPQESVDLPFQNGGFRVPLEEIIRTCDDLDRQRAESKARQRASDTEPVQGPSTPESTFRPPQTPPSRKCHRTQQEGLLTPPPSGPSRSRKRPRLLDETVQLQQQSLDEFLQYQESCFHAKRDASLSRSWCKEVPLALQVETSKSFYEAFTDERTLPISHCTFCYRKCPPAKITTIHWTTYLAPALLQATTALQKCRKCLPPDGGDGVDICLECRGVFENGKLPKAWSVNNMDIGCEHRYPGELDGLSPVEERLIALQAPFGYITKFTVDNKTPSGVSYRKHVKGHIVVFPNNVDDLVATVLPHPLLQTIENIHVSWSGANRPSPAEVGTLLQVRKSRVTAALLWLQRNNPLYKDIEINLGEIQGWQYAEGSTVPTVLMERMQRRSPRPWKRRTRTPSSRIPIAD
uniref:DUF6570 domain-containing protein n=1 Tax=Bionectria ochroleuca TaxID=29856 RepID=A0A8H7K5M9_BIOOC